MFVCFVIGNRGEPEDDLPADLPAFRGQIGVSAQEATRSVDPGGGGAQGKEGRGVLPVDEGWETEGGRLEGRRPGPARLGGAIRRRLWRDQTSFLSYPKPVREMDPVSLIVQSVRLYQQQQAALELRRQAQCEMT